MIDFIDEKRRKIQEILPSLLTKQKESVKYEVHIYEGEKGLKAIHENILNELKANEKFMVLGAPKEAHDKFEPYFLDFHKRRLKKKINLRGIYKKEAKKYAELREKMNFTQVRYFHEKLISPMWVTLYNDKTILFVVGDTLLGIVIKNITIHNNFSEYFELLWKIAKR